MENHIKFYKAIKTLKNNVEYTFFGEIKTENDFNKVEWKTGENSNGIMISTTTNPHSEITWTKVKEEMDKL